MNFSVEEENLICMYHTSDRRRTMARMLTALPDMDTEMRRLANGTIAKLERMTDVQLLTVYIIAPIRLRCNTFFLQYKPFSPIK